MTYNFVIQERIRPPAAIKQRVTKSMTYNFVIQEVFIELNIWEDFIDAMSTTRLQDEYNNAVKTCDIFIVLFSTKVGKYSKEEFETAFGQFIKTKKPSIYTYFKDAAITVASANIEGLQSLKDFQKRLSELGHFPTEYQNISQLCLHFTGQLDKLNITQKPQEFINTLPANKPKEKIQQPVNEAVAEDELPDWQRNLKDKLQEQFDKPELSELIKKFIHNLKNSFII